MKTMKTMESNVATDGRKLSPMDSYYFDNCFAPLSGVFGFKSAGMGSDANLVKAFRQVVNMSPILQTVVYGVGSEACFRQVASVVDLPSLTVAPREKDDDSALSTARKLMNKAVEEITAGGQDAHRTSVRLVAVRGPSRLEFALVVPHHFLDGTGVATLMSMLYAYARCPKLVWPFINRLCQKEQVPGFMEVALKHEYETLKNTEVDIQQSAKVDPNNFMFPDYDMAAPDAVSKLCGLTADDVGCVSSKVLRSVCSELRSGNNVTITSAFHGLAVKVLAILLKEEGIILDNDSPLLATTGVDVRGQGKWNDRRDGAKRFPILANYTYSLATQITQQDALDKTVEGISEQIKDTYDRANTDAKFRMQEITPSPSRLLPTSNMFVGASSVIVPRIVNRLGIQATVDCKIVFGPVPHVWFYVITCGKETMVSADVQLPLKVSGDTVRMAILSAVKDSALEPLFESLARDLPN